ncbi:MAG: hypothetical protein KA479_00820 [Saprospiraceae bacterium]|jgi:hypothetical protein|nr:hypothetical protein [Saprospiraceae bacterium]
MTNHTKKAQFFWVLLVAGCGVSIWMYSINFNKSLLEVKQMTVVEKVNEEQSRSLSMEGIVISLAKAVMHAMLPNRG